jgi:tetratricopeptide (TPR) repeat protein
MRKHILITLLLCMFSSLAFAQMAKVQGQAKDEAGQPIADAQVEFQNIDTGQKYTLKTDKSGKYTHIAMQPGMYKVSLIKDGNLLFSFNKVQLTLTGMQDGITFVDFDLAKEKSAPASAAGTGGQQQAPKLTEEQKKAMEEQKKAAEENLKIKGLNEKLVAAKNAETAGNWTQAVAIMEETTALDGTRDLLWARLGDVHLGAGKAVDKSDQAAAKQHYTKSVAAYQKALAIKKQGNYHNNYGQALARAGKPKEALLEYTNAAVADPPNAAMYFFNAGATLTNESMTEKDPTLREKYIDEANNAFDKAIAAKPDYAEAWYQKGLNLFANAKVDPKTNKIAPREGTAEAFQKYLEIEPEGKYSAEAKGIIESLGGTVQTTYKKRKPK